MGRTGQPPRLLLERYPSHRWTAAWDYQGLVTTWRGDLPAGEVLYAKIKPADTTITLLAEGARMRWLSPWLPAPEVLECATHGEVDLLVTRGLPGRSAAHRDDDPAVRVARMARALRAFHDGLDVTDCPFDFRLDAAFEQVQARIDSGIVLDELHSLHQPLGVRGAFNEVTRSRPDENDPVVCHGDYCFPNVLFDDDGGVTGYIDLGELGVADRWWDLAVATWSVEWNVGSQWEDLFLDSYGVDRDVDRQAYYRLLYDLAS